MTVRSDPTVTPAFDGERATLADALIHAFGWRGALLHGDPTSFDRFRWLRKHLRPGPLRTLDAGCGSGTFTLFAASIGNEAVGISHGDQRKAQRRARICGLGAQFLQHDLRRLAELVHELEPFDQVLCFECLEHIMDDRTVVRHLSRLVKPGGQLLVTVPYKHYRRLLGDKISPVEDGGHVRWGYTHEEMAAILAEQGLRVIEQDTVSGVVSQKIANAQRVLARAPVAGGLAGWALTLPFRPLVGVDRVVTRAIAYPYLSIAVVAVKD
ncbi:MAG TPA: class I SAM-dependent methyltransferase [Polyangiaceae bacterium]|jgi:SAM-dependent methyltransferase|nr:class I SAM-dependent methyltransferase [Polyangiaceae bacterium]